MYTHDFLEQIKESIYGPHFMTGILALQEDSVKEGEYRTQIRDYKLGLEMTLPTFSEEEKERFEEYEAACRMIREQYAIHGFMAGVYAGFRHIFTPFKEVDAGYDKYVANEVMMAKNIPRYQELYQAVLKRNQIYNMLANGRVNDSYSPLVSISCYWDEMACSAGSLAFYCGYRAAHAITDRFGLLETNYEARISKLLVLEHTFGYIETVAERDRRKERQSNGTWGIGIHDSINGEDEEESECQTAEN